MGIVAIITAMLTWETERERERVDGMTYLDYHHEWLFVARVVNCILLSICYGVTRRHGSAKDTKRYLGWILAMYIIAVVAASLSNLGLFSDEAMYRVLPYEAILDLICFSATVFLPVSLMFLYVHVFRILLNPSTVRKVYKVLQVSGLVYCCCLLAVALYQGVYMADVHRQGFEYFVQVQDSDQFDRHYHGVYSWYRVLSSLAVSQLTCLLIGLKWIKRGFETNLDHIQMSVATKDTPTPTPLTPPPRRVVLSKLDFITYACSVYCVLYLGVSGSYLLSNSIPPNFYRYILVPCTWLDGAMLAVVILPAYKGKGKGGQRRGTAV
ncbi:hypothetical protein KIPB_003038 [Kipferlia bialata]|uniref:Uncharacterized protein n=1 Tax=Kipferlia bialata TaxID=797122 RepID=A0A9K3CUS8_9EUKA|nr:hypothetical protein KIPB_003038 [Kipferlia bialata]|eukprot:g3038.t1